MAREWWISPADERYSDIDQICETELRDAGWFHVREVEPGEVTITREEFSSLCDKLRTEVDLYGLQCVEDKVFGPQTPKERKESR